MEQQDLDSLKDKMRSTWMAGDFGVIAKTIAGSGEEFVSRLGIAAGQHVLDLACGTGNLALPAARLGAVVTGADIAPNLLEQARERATAEGLSVQFDEGDAEQLPYADASFDLVITMFGAMFAPRPAVVAAEMARVLKPGGVLAMANWSPASFTGKMFRLGSQHAPPPPGVLPPVQWGDPAIAAERLAPHFDDIKTDLIPIDFDMQLNAAGAVDLFRKFFGPTVTAFNRLDAEGQVAFHKDLVALWESNNIAPAPSTHILIRNEYLQVIARKK